MNTTAIFLGFIFGVIGFAFVMYGKKQRVATPLVCGVLLMLLPLVTVNTTLLISVGLVICILPYFIRI